jgi:hypothetical protein
VFSFYNAKTSRSIYYSGAFLYPPNLRTILICVYQIAYWQWIYWIFQRLLSSNLHYSLLLLGFLMQNMVFYTVFYTILNIFKRFEDPHRWKMNQMHLHFNQGFVLFLQTCWTHLQGLPIPQLLNLNSILVEVGMSNCLMCVSLATIWYDRS